MSYRQLNFFGLFLCIAAMLFALVYLENTLYLDPCPLCSVTRLIIIFMASIFLLALVHNPKTFGQRTYAFINSLIALCGLGVQAWHIHLQNLPADQVPACGPGLDYLIQTLPLFQVIKQVFEGSGDCAAISWTLFGLSIPAQTLILFVVLLLLCITLMRRRQRYSRLI